MNPPSLAIVVSPPLWQRLTPNVQTQTLRPAGYQHTIQATGGYWSAQFKVPSNRRSVEEWLSFGLGRHVEVYSSSLKVCWEGFVNQIDAQIAGLSLSRGPLLDVGNHAVVAYSPAMTSALGTPVGGSRSYTTAAQDTDSQARWSIREKVVSAGSMTPLCADYVRDTWLADNADPGVAQSFGSGQGLGATVQCLGYWHLLDFPYVNLTMAGAVAISNPTTPASGKIQRIIAAEPNGIFPQDYTSMEANAWTVDGWENANTPANDLIRSLIAVGGSTNQRYVGGFYAGRRFYYNVMPANVAYHQKLSHPLQIVTDTQGNEIKPWNVLPGRWLHYPDLLIGQQTPPSRKQDLRYEFIESVTYNSEATPAISHQGGKTDLLPQVLARWGLGGA